MYLITGASGFIGSHFHQVIPNEQIVNFDLREPPFPNSATFVKGDIRVREQFQHVLSKYPVDTIIALAAKHNDFGIGHDEYFDTNEDGTRVMCEAASGKNVRRIVFFSSVAVYGEQTEPTNEQTSPAPVSSYGASKLAGEEVLREWANEDPQRSVLILRPALVYGIGNKANMYNLIRQVDSGFYFHVGKADNIKSIAYVENIVAATLFLLRTLPSGVSTYNYSDNQQLTSRQLANTIASILHKRILFTLPLPLAVAFGLPFDLMIKISGRNLPISSARIKKLAMQTWHLAEKIRGTGFIPAFNSVEGLEKMTEWYKKGDVAWGA